MGRRSNHRQAGNSSGLASCRLPSVLEVEIKSRRPTDGKQGTSESRPYDGVGERRLGCTKDPRELLKPGFKVSESSVERYLRRLRRRGEPGKRWIAFLNNHRESIVAFDFLRRL